MRFSIILITTSCDVVHYHVPHHPQNTFGDDLCDPALENTTSTDVYCRYISIYRVWPGSQWRGWNVTRSTCDVMTHSLQTSPFASL